MKFKLKSARFDSISGWCYDPEQPQEVATIELLVDGELVDSLACNRRRRDLKPEEFPNRMIGFGGSLPVHFWNGQNHLISLRLSGTETILAEREIETRDARIDNNNDVFGELLDSSNGRLYGWLSHADEPATIQVEIDGVPYIRVVADRQLREYPVVDCGFVIWLPAALHDGESHALRLVALIKDRPALPFASMTRIFNASEALTIDGDCENFANNTITGRATLLQLETEPVELVAEINGVEVGQCTTQPEHGGAFELEIEPPEHFVLGRHRIDIYSPITGTIPEFLRANIVAKFTSIHAAPAESGAMRLTAAFPIKVTEIDAAEVEVTTADSTTIYTAEFKPGRRSRLVSDLDIPHDLRSINTLRLRIAKSISVDINYTVPEQPEAPESPDIPQGPDVKTVLQRRDCAGEWHLKAGGQVRGRIELPHDADHPTHVTLFLNGIEAATAKVDFPLPQSAAIDSADWKMSGVFQFDLARIRHVDGFAHVDVRAPNGVMLPSAGRTRIRFPIAAVDGRSNAGRLYNIPNDTTIPDEERALFRTPFDANLANTLSTIFKTDLPVGGNLALALRTLALSLSADANLLSALSSPGAQPDPNRWKPFDLPTSDTLLALPATSTTRAKLVKARDWRSILRHLFADEILFPAVLSQDNWQEMSSLHQIWKAGGRTRTEQSTPINLRTMECGAYTDALRGALEFAVIDQTGNPILQSRRITDLIQLSDPPASKKDSSEELHAAGWLLLFIDSSGGATALPIAPIGGAGKEPAAVHTNITLKGISVASRHATVTVTGRELHRKVTLHLGDEKVTLKACPPMKKDKSASSELIETQTYASSIPRWIPPALPLNLRSTAKADTNTYDLRLGDANGLRPQNLPTILLVEPEPDFAASALSIRGGRMSGWIFHRAEEPGRVSVKVVVLIPQRPDAPTDASEISSTEKTIAKVLANEPSDEADDLYAAKASGYTIEIPSRLLDGQKHLVRVIATAGTYSTVLWASDFCADDDFVNQQIAEVVDPRNLHRLLLTLTHHKRFDIIDTFFSDSTNLTNVKLSADATFEIVCSAAAIGGCDERWTNIRNLFTLLWTSAEHQENRATTMQTAAAKAALRAQTSTPPERYPHGPAVEAAIDLVLTTSLNNAVPSVILGLAAVCTQSRRHRLASSILTKGLEVFPHDAGLLVQLSSTSLALGDVSGAERAALAALAQKPRSPSGLLALARAYSRQGRGLHAASALSHGKGLSHWLTKPLTYEQSKLIASLDWLGVMKLAANASDNTVMLATLATHERVLGEAIHPGELGFTIVLPETLSGDIAKTFASLKSVGCLQIIDADYDRLADVACLGQWTLFYFGQSPPTPEIIISIFQQMRFYDPIANLVTGSVSESGVPTDFENVGALIRSDALRVFGAVSLSTFLDSASNKLRMKTILI